MNLMIDTNILLDVLLKRQLFARDAAMLFSAADRKMCSGFICATSVTTVDYVLSKAIGKTKSLLAIKNLLSLFQVAPVDHSVLQSATAIGFSDFEDAVLHQAAAAVHADFIVTRNPGDFKKAAIPVHTPTEMLLILRAKQN